MGLLPCVRTYAAAGAENQDIRRTLVQAIMADGAEQQKLLTELADSGDKVVADVLTSAFDSAGQRSLHRCFNSR